MSDDEKLLRKFVKHSVSGMYISELELKESKSGFTGKEVERILNMIDELFPGMYKYYREGY